VKYGHKKTVYEIINPPRSQNSTFNKISKPNLT